MAVEYLYLITVLLAVQGNVRWKNNLEPYSNAFSSLKQKDKQKQTKNKVFFLLNHS